MTFPTLPTSAKAKNEDRYGSWFTHLYQWNDRILSCLTDYEAGSLGGTTLTTDELAAVNGANAPDASNVFATMADLVAGGALASGKIIVGDALGAAAAVTMSGDGSLSNAGVFAITADSIVNADIKTNAAIAYSKLAALATGEMLVGNAGTPTATPITGDVTVGATGVTAIGAGKVTSAMLAGSVDPAKITLTSAYLMVGNGSNVGAGVAMSGDGTLTNAGVFAIAADCIVNANINTAAAIALSKLGANDLGSFTGAVVPGTDAAMIVDNGTLKSATYQVFQDGLDDLTAKAACAAAADKIVITDSAASGVAKNITAQYLFDGVHNLTALAAAPAADDLLLVTDEGTGGDPAKTITIQNLFDGIANLTQFTGAIVEGTDQVFIDDAGTVKRATVQVLMDGVDDFTALGANAAADDKLLVIDTDASAVAKNVTVAYLLGGVANLTALAAAPALTDNLLLDDAGAAKSITAQYFLNVLGDLPDLGAVPAVDDRLALTDESAAGDPAVSTTVENFFSAAGDVTALAAAPAIDDLMLITDESTAGDPARAITVQELFDASNALAAGAVADGDSIVIIQGGVAKKEAVADVATLLAGKGLSATSSVLNAVDAVWPMAAYGTWAVDGDGAETNGAGLVGDVTLTEAAAAFAVILDGAEYAPISTDSSLGGVTANYQLFPDAPAEADAVFFGNAVPFAELAIDVATAATYDAAAVIAWKYYNGATWATLTIAQDSTDTSDQSGERSFQQDGAITFVPPSDWATTTINGQLAYWIKAEIAAGKAANMTQVPITNSKEHELVTPTDGFTCPAAGSIANVRAIDAATTLHTAADIKFMLVNFTTGAHSGELTWAQDQRQDKWNIAAGLAVADGDELGVVVTQEDGTNEALNVMLELEVSLT